MSESIEVSQLRVGMFIHLDLGWMAHPFPLSSFRIASADQIETVRGLGLARVRWDPARSEVEEVAGAGLLEAEPPPPAPEAPVPSAAAQAQAARQRAMEAQEQATELCERQFAEAARDVRRIHDQSRADPAAALADVNRLTTALLDKMLTADSLNVRVLTEATGERAATHALNVTTVAMLLGRQQQLVRTDLGDLGAGALLHDVGKQMLPDRLRLRRDDFSTSELAAYRQHVAHGVAVAHGMGVAQPVLLAVAQHHEFLDGSGFPQGAAGDKISPLARLVGLVNAFDNLCNPAEAAKALTPHEALSRLYAQGRGKYDPTLISALIRLLGIYPPGSVVELSDSRLALVTSVNDTRPLKPCVVAYDGKASSQKLSHLDLADYPDLGVRRSLRPDQLPAAAASYLRPRRRLTYFFDAASPHDDEPAA